MAGKRSYRPRRGGKKGRKPTVAAAKRVVAKAHKRAAKSNKDTFFLMAKTGAVLTPTQGITVSNYIYQHFPLLQNGSALAVTSIPEFNLYRLQYDQVRVNSVRVVVKPKANVLDAQNAQNDAAITLGGSGMCYTAIDRDGPAPSNIAAIERYPSFKKYSLLKGFSRTYSIKWDQQVWLDCQNIYAGSQDDVLRRFGCLGGITIYAQDILEDAAELLNEPWADVEVYYTCVFRGKTSASITTNDDGSVTLVPQENFTPLPFSPLGVGTHSGVVTAINNAGAEITMSDRQDHT